LGVSANREGDPDLFHAVVGILKEPFNEFFIVHAVEPFIIAISVFTIYDSVQVCIGDCKLVVIHLFDDKSISDFIFHFIVL
jgi:hypothetical protein